MTQKKQTKVNSDDKPEKMLLKTWVHNDDPKALTFLITYMLLYQEELNPEFIKEIIAIMPESYLIRDENGFSRLQVLQQILKQTEIKIRNAL